jgi:hypothetical protein
MVQSFLWLSRKRKPQMDSGNTLMTSLCTCSSGSFPGWGVRVPWCPAGWCMSGDVLFLVKGQLTKDWDLNLGSTHCGPHTEGWSPPHKAWTSSVCCGPSLTLLSWLQANIMFYYAIGNHDLDYALDWLDDLYPQWNCTLLFVALHLNDHLKIFLISKLTGWLMLMSLKYLEATLGLPSWCMICQGNSTDSP